MIIRREQKKKDTETEKETDNHDFRQTQKQETEVDKQGRKKRLPKSCAGGQGPYLRSLYHLGRSGEVKEIRS